jgi:two-component system, cell cycle response regulator DivK
MAQKKSGDGPTNKSGGRKSASAPKRPRTGADESSSDASGQNASQQGGGALVLVVDDYQDAREMCCEYLTYCGFRVAEARNGQEAIDKAAQLLPDLILMDLSLPGMDGWEATRRLKADDKTKKIPVVALTGHALAGHSDGAKAAGCDSFITKPCMPDALVAEVKRMLDSRSDSRPDNDNTDNKNNKGKSRSKSGS